MKKNIADNIEDIIYSDAFEKLNKMAQEKDKEEREEMQKYVDFLHAMVDYFKCDDKRIEAVVRQSLKILKGEEK